MKLSLLISLILVAGTLVSCGSDSGTSTSTTTTTYTSSTPDGACSSSLVSSNNDIYFEKNKLVLASEEININGDTYDNMRDFITAYKRFERVCDKFKKEYGSIEMCKAVINYKEIDFKPQDSIQECERVKNITLNLAQTTMESYPEFKEI